MKNILMLSIVIAGLATTINLKSQFNSNPENKQIQEEIVQNENITKAVESRVITAYGDSLTAGYGLSSEQSYPSLLQRKLDKEGYKYKVVNAGLSGDTTQAGLSRINWVLKTNPEIVLLELGANDALRGLPPENAKKNLEKIIQTLQAKKINILLAGMMSPRNLGEKYTKSFDSIYPELSKKYKIPLIPFFLQGVAMDRTLNISDGVHPNPKGYVKILENNIWKHIKPMLRK